MKIDLPLPTIGHIGDMHFGVKNGNKYFLEFQVNYIKAKLRYFNSLGIKTVIQAGDAIDNRKRSETNVIEAIQDICKYADNLGIIIIFIVGNHNTFYVDSNHLHNLNVVKHFNNVIIVEEHATCYYKDEPIYLLLGWIHKNNHDDLMAEVEKSTAKYCVMHADFDGFQMYKGIEAKGGMSIVPFRSFKRVITGHYHTISNNDNVDYIGSPYALTWMDWVDGTNRGVFVHNIENNDFQLIKNTDNETLFVTVDYDPLFKYDEEYFKQFENKVVKFFVKKIENKKHYDQFVKFVNGVSYIDRRIINEEEIAIIEHANIDIRSMNMTPVKVIDEYVRKEAAESGLDENAVSAEAISIYHEAQKSLAKIN